MLTDTRLVLYAKGDKVSLSPVGGIVSVKDDYVVAEEKSALRTLHYSEKGFFAKTGIITLHGERTLRLTGPAKLLKEIFQALQTHFASVKDASSRMP